MQPSRSSRGLEAIICDVIDTRDGATYFAEWVGVSLFAMSLADVIRSWAAARPISNWLTEHGSAII